MTQALPRCHPRGAARGAEPFRTEVADLGVPAANLDRALQVAAELEHDELIRRGRFGT